MAARVVAEKGQNAPVDSLESLKGYAALWDAGSQLWTNQSV
jgi:hypothetical protein